MKKDFENQIKEKLNLSYEKANFFAWLCAVRVLPLLGAEGNLKFWKIGERQKQLLSILRAIDRNQIEKIDYLDDLIDRMDFRMDVLNTGAIDAIGADFVALTATSSVLFRIKSPYTYVKVANNANITATYYGIDLKPILLQDLDAITVEKNCFYNDVTIYGKIWDEFQNALHKMGCSYWGNWYTNLFANGFKLEDKDQEEIRLRLNAPAAIINEGAAAVAKYMANLKMQGKKETKEARIILLGTKGAGKTSLAKKLQNENASLPRKDQSTSGIDTLKLDFIPNETTHLWDFGGHVIVQTVHKCFMSAECVYVLVVYGRGEEQKEIDYFRKWLTTVKTYSKGSAKVFIVLNKFDPHDAPIPKEKIEEEFPNLVAGYYDLNFSRIKRNKSDKDTLRNFKAHIRNYIETNFT
ncbi:MAG: ADP-ribosylation factor-like protein [Defluviitaleaceae bacterium]|nr:ADP-ribosylation factor-like protein [Defluviitaleaceae bacterium]